MGFFESLGHTAAGCAKAFGEVCAFVGETLVEAVGMMFRPRRFRLGDMALAFQRAAFEGLPVTTGVGFLLGVILGNMADENLRRALILGDGDISPFFTRPISIFFLLFILVLVLPQIPPVARLGRRIKAKLFPKKTVGKAA